MVNQKSIQTIDSSIFKNSYLKPLYDSYCFSRVPGTVIKLLGGESSEILSEDVLPAKRNYEKVFVLFLDAFGWELFERYKDKYPFLQRFMTDGVVSKATSQFPSTTAVHVTTMHTGLTAWQHGIPEYRYYDPVVDDVIEPLNFSLAGEKGITTLDKLNISPESIYPTTTIYQKLNSLDVDAYLLADANFINSPYNKVVSNGGRNIPYKTTTEGLVQLYKQVTKAGSVRKQYYYLYFDQLDKICHAHGTNSLEVEAEIDSLMHVLERYFYELTFSNQKDALLMVIADHGQVNLDFSKAVYLNQRIPEIAKYLRKNANGKLIMPGGAPRLMFIYPETQYIEKVTKLLKENLADIADILTLDELQRENILISVDQNPAYRHRLPEIFIQPFDDAAVWWYEKEKFEITKRGNHGGLARAEMEIPILTLNS